MYSAGTPFSADHDFSGYNTSDWIAQLPRSSTPTVVNACRILSFECSFLSTCSAKCWKLIILAEERQAD